MIDGLLYHDPFMVLADFASYAECQTQVNQAYEDREHWMHMSILNTARTGKFSSDRSIREYAETIWRTTATPVPLLTPDEVSFGVLQ